MIGTVDDDVADEAAISSSAANEEVDNDKQVATIKSEPVSFVIVVERKV
jgi:hypothetical protein